MSIVSIQNVSTRPCRLEGYPVVVLIGPSRAPLVTVLHQATEGAYLFPAIPERRVALPSGAWASFQFAYAAVSGGPQAGTPPDFGCPAGDALRITLPGVLDAGTLDMATRACDGWISVTPVFPGRDWISFQ